MQVVGSDFVVRDYFNCKLFVKDHNWNSKVLLILHMILLEKGMYCVEVKQCM